MAISGRAQIAANVVRRLNAAVKARRLYGAGHPLRAQTVSAFLTAIVSFHERYGGLVLETHRDGLILEGQPFEGGESIDSLALDLYSIGVWQLVLLPGLTESELEKLLDIVTTEPDTILEQGGLTGLLVKEGIDRVRVIELRPGEEEPANLTLEIYHRLLEGTLSAEEQRALVSVLRAGPDQAARLLSLVVERTKQAFADSTGAVLGERVYKALAALDRLIVDAPAAESPDLLKHLARAVTNIDDPQRHLMHRAILQRAAHDLSARALLSAMTSEQIARMVIPCLEAGEPPPQLAQVINGLPFDPQKARDALALVAQHTGRSFDLPPALEELRLPPWVRDIPQDLADFVVSDADVALSDADVRALAAEAKVEDATLRADHTMAMLHLALADDPSEAEATLAMLAADIAAQASQGNIEMIGTIVHHLHPAARATDAKGALIRAALRRLLVDAFATRPAKEIAGWPEDHPLLVALRKSGRTVGAELAHALATERDLTRRPAIAALLTRVGDSAVDAITPLLSDRNLDVVKAVIPVLVHMRSASAIAPLRGLTRHPDVRVRKEAVAALGPAPGSDAQTALMAFLRDPDPQVSETCVRFVRPETARKHSPELIAMLGDRALGRRPMLRMRLIDLLVQAGAKEAIPAVRKLASPFKLRRMDRTMARYARTAIKLLEQGQARREVVV